jgi:hypothetical protein
MTGRVTPGTALNQRLVASNHRGAVTAEKAILTVLVIVFAWAGIHFLSDPMRDPLFRVVFAICDRIYQTIASVFF